MQQDILTATCLKCTTIEDLRHCLPLFVIVAYILIFKAILNFPGITRN